VRRGFLILQLVIWSMCVVIEYQMYTKITRIFQTKEGVVFDVYRAVHLDIFL